jgi:aspartate aminotransferase
MKDFTIFIDGISKAFAATGVRVGWAMAPAEVIVKMRGLNSHVGSWAPMAEQKAVARFLLKKEDVSAFLENFKKEIELRLINIYNGIKSLQKKGYPVDAVSPQAAIYLTMQINLVGKRTETGTVLQNQGEVTEYLLNEAHLAIVPFYAFGAGQQSNWYRLSVGCCKKAEIPAMLQHLEDALSKLS